MRRPNAFTMIEMLVATAIAAMLMLAVLSVTASLGRSRQVVESQTLEPSWRGCMIRVMDRDFALSRRVELYEDGHFMIEGVSHLTDPVEDSAGSRIRHLPGSVSYALVETDPGVTLLVREQAGLHDTGSEEPSKTLLCMNVASITASALYAPSESEDDEPIPTGIELVIVFKNGEADRIRRQWDLPRVDTVESQ